MPISYNDRPVSRMQPGDHLCLCFESEAERRTVLRTFVTDGIRSGHKVLYLADADPGTALAPYNSRLRAARAQGQLDIRPAGGVHDHGSAFDHAPVTTGLRDEIDRAERAGHRGFRLATDAVCFADDRAGGASAVEDEQAIQEVFEIQEVFDETGAMAICPYDRGSLDHARLQRIEQTHRTGRVRANDLYDDGMLRMAPLFAPRGVAFHGELDVTIKGPASSALRTISSEVPGDVYVDLSALEFCDVGALRTFVRLSDELVREGRRLVLGAAPRFLREMAQLCGWSGLPGLIFDG